MKTIAIIVLLLLPCWLPAHEFWLQPEKFIHKRGETINIRFMLGENYAGHNWLGNATRIQSLKYYTGTIRDDLSALISLDMGDSLQLAMFDEGTAMVAFQSTNALLEMKARRFNEYLQQVALEDILAYRREKKEMNDKVRESYQRNVKTLFQVGTKMNNCFRQATGLPLDIIPQTNPYALRNNQALTVRVLFHRKPFANRCVKVWQRVNGRSVLQDFRTDAKGDFTLKVRKRGRWMVSAVAMERVLKGKADWQSYWGSLTWGYGR